MRIRVADKRVGECIVNSNEELSKEQEYALKSLCMLQLMCINIDTKNQNYIKFLDILRETTRKLDKVYGDKQEDANPFEQFNASIV